MVFMRIPNDKRTKIATEIYIHSFEDEAQEEKQRHSKTDVSLMEECT